MGEYSGVQLLQLGSGIHPQLVGEAAAGTSHRPQGVALSSGPEQGQ